MTTSTTDAEAIARIIEAEIDHDIKGNIAWVNGKRAATAILSYLASRWEAKEPVAWIEFADNGNIRFWTSNPARAWTEGDNGRPLRKFTLAELVALAASPRLDREKVLAALKPFAEYAAALASLPDTDIHLQDTDAAMTLGHGPDAKRITYGDLRRAREAADAIMRETR